MSAQIKPEWVGRMAAAQWHYEWPDREFCREPNDLQDFYYESARTALEAVAPLIAAQVLRDTAMSLGENQMIREGDVKDWLRNRANRIEKS